VRFPNNIAYVATGGPEFGATVVVSGAGHEQRNGDAPAALADASHRRSSHLSKPLRNRAAQVPERRSSLESSIQGRSWLRLFEFKKSGRDGEGSSCRPEFDVRLLVCG
jgi:hypothetical protein